MMLGAWCLPPDPKWAKSNMCPMPTIVLLRLKFLTLRSPPTACWMIPCGGQQSKNETHFFPPNQVVREILLSIWLRLSIRPQSHWAIFIPFSCIPQLIIYQDAYLKSRCSAESSLQFLKHLASPSPTTPVSSGHEHQLTCALPQRSVSAPQGSFS